MIIHSSSELMSFCYLPLVRVASLETQLNNSYFKALFNCKKKCRIFIAHGTLVFNVNMWIAVEVFRLWLRVFSGETMAGRFYHRSFSENVLQVGVVFALFVFNWFRSKGSLDCVVGFLVKNISWNLLLISVGDIWVVIRSLKKQHSLWFTTKQWQISAKKACEKQPISCFFFAVNKGILAFDLFSFSLSKKSPPNPVNQRL